MLIKGKNRIEVMIKIFLLIISIMIAALNDNGITSAIASLYLLIINLYAVIKSRKQWTMLIVFSLILWFNYSFLIVNYILPVKSFYTSFADDSAIYVSLNIVLIFNSILILLFNFNQDNVIHFSDCGKRNDLIASFFFLICTAIFINAIIQISVGDRSNTTSIYEYCVVFFLFGFYYSQKSFFRIPLIILSLLFILIDLLGGNRIVAMELMLCLFIVFLEKKAKIRHLIIFVPVAILVFTIVGMIRGNNTSINLSLTFDKLLKDRFALDTSYSAYFTSITYVKVADLISFNERIGFLLRYILYIFVGSSVGNFDISAFTRTFYAHSYGGVLPFYGYFYLGFFGVVLCSLYVAFISNYINKRTSKGGLALLLSVFFAISVPRWYLYSPSQITRSFVFIIILYFVCTLIDRAMFKDTTRDCRSVERTENGKNC